MEPSRTFFSLTRIFGHFRICLADRWRVGTKKRPKIFSVLGLLKNFNLLFYLPFLKKNGGQRRN